MKIDNPTIITCLVTAFMLGSVSNNIPYCLARWWRGRKFRAEEWWACYCGHERGWVKLNYPLHKACQQCGKQRPDDDVTKDMKARLGIEN